MSAANPADLRGKSLSMAITLDQIRWVAHLARLELGQAEIEGLARDLGAIVEYVNQLQKVNTDGVEPLAHALDMHNVFRADEPAPSLPEDAALANAPARKGDFYTVPTVLE
jgi:aspartyl-tRNA(Asn)/glutamyl-tRNA(Gln) amidotransferase subunit C